MSKEQRRQTNAVPVCQFYDDLNININNVSSILHCLIVSILSKECLFLTEYQSRRGMLELGNHQWTLKLEGESLMRNRILIAICHSINYKYKKVK